MAYQGPAERQEKREMKALAGSPAGVVQVFPGRMGNMAGEACLVPRGRVEKRERLDREERKGLQGQDRQLLDRKESREREALLVPVEGQVPRETPGNQERGRRTGGRDSQESLVSMGKRE